MSFSALKKDDIKSYSINALDGGLSLEASSDRIPHNCLKECVNMWYSGGRLKTRPGIHPLAPLKNITEYETVKQGLTITDAVYYKDGVKYNVAYFITHDDVSFVRIYYYLVDINGQSIPIGEMMFNRVSSDTFYIPQSIFVAVGDKTLGAGIYVFIARKSGQNEQYNIYEASANLKEWLDCRNNYYVPVLYINGLGTRYNEARDIYSLSYPTPQFLEQRNLLTGEFKVYFTSDGISSVFNMPISNIDSGTAVHCRIYSDSKSYTEWIIPVNSDTATSKFSGDDVTVRCDRKAGVISFLHGADPYHIPLLPYCSNNNIVIKACKSVTNGLSSVVSSKHCLVYNSRLFVCGNTKKPNEIYSARLSNPLYFPQNAKTAAGDSTSGITALGLQSNKLIAFKASECYRIDINRGKEQNSPVLIDRTEDIGATDRLEAVAISERIGCDCPHTVARCGNRLVWADSNGQVYMLVTTTYGKENNIYKLSLPLAHSIADLGADTLKTAFAVVHKGYYMLIADGNAYLMYHRVKGFGYSPQYTDNANPTDTIAWYYWKLPEGIKISTGITAGETCVLGAVDSEALWCYCATFKDGPDKVIVSDTVKFTEEYHDIDTVFATADLDFDAPERFKRVECVSIDAALTYGGKIILSDGKKMLSRSLLSQSGVLKQNGINPVRKLSVRVEGTGDTKVGAIAFKYKTL